MKKMFIISCMAIFAMACNNNDAKTGTPADSTGTSKMEAVNAPLPEMPYTLERPYQNWQTGDPQHALTVMKSLKAYETGDIAGAVTAFGDSVDVRFDHYRAKLSNDSLKKVFTMNRAGYVSLVVKMSDWESVISADKKEEWVTLWYKEIFTDKTGKADSLSVVDDVLMVKGKIVLLDEKIQHFPAPPKK